MEVGAHNQQKKSAAGERGECALARGYRRPVIAVEQKRADALRRGRRQRVRARIVSAQNCGRNGIAHIEGYTRVKSEELLRRITVDPAVMDGQACIRGMRMPAVMVQP